MTPTIEEIHKDYIEWVLGFLKCRLDLKPEYYDEHYHDNFTYECCAESLWYKVKNTVEELLWYKEKNQELENYIDKLSKIIDKLTPDVPWCEGWNSPADCETCEAYECNCNPKYVEGR